VAAGVLAEALGQGEGAGHQGGEALADVAVGEREREGLRGSLG